MNALIADFRRTEREEEGGGGEIFLSILCGGLVL